MMGMGVPRKHSELLELQLHEKLEILPLASHEDDQVQSGPLVGDSHAKNAKQWVADAGERALDPSKSEEKEASKELVFSRGRSVITIITLTAIISTCSMSTGLVTVGIPTIAKDIDLPENLLLWPGSVYSLSNGCCLLLAGAIADLVGSRTINLIGTLIMGVSIAAAGGSKTSTQLIAFRAMEGFGASMGFPTAVSIITSSFPRGRTRNAAFACLDFGQPFGFQIGLILGGVFIQTPLTWRFPFYVASGAILVFFLISCWYLPRDPPKERVTLSKVIYGIDWVPIVLSSACLGCLNYVFALVVGSVSVIHVLRMIALLTLAGVLAIAFVLWMWHQERQHKPALIPNSLWSNLPFSSICLMVLLTWAVMESMDWFLSLLYQQVQLVSAVEASLRYLPNVLLGIVVNIGTGLVVHRLPTNLFVVAVSAISTISPLLMGIVNPNWSWWTCIFWAVLIGPCSADVIFTVSNLIITDVFPEDTQALAGAVFNTIAQVGTALGLAITALIAGSVTSKSGVQDKMSPAPLMPGYRAAFWACFAFIVTATLIGAVGLRKVWRVGAQREI